ncbi:hypothetical protein HGRIS_000271 [Hohenbuehelia grisea]
MSTILLGLTAKSVVNGEVSLCQHHLWTFINVSFEPSQGPYGALNKYAALMLERSRNSPVKVIKLHEERGLVEDIALLDLLIKHRHRWQCLEITVWDDPTLLMRIKGPLSNLRELFVDGVDIIDLPPPVEAFEDAPSLEDVTVEGFSISTLLLPLHQLRHLAASFWSLRQEWVSLQGAVQLVTLEISSAVRDFLEDPPSVINLPQVERLSIVAFRSNILQYFLLPSLTSLEITDADDFDVPFGPLLCDFFSRSNCQLESLTLEQAPKMSDQELLSVLIAQPTLRELTLTAIGEPYTAVFPCQDPDSPDSFLPRLTTLHLSCVSVNPPDFLDFLEARCGAVDGGMSFTRLHEVVLKDVAFEPLMSSSDRERFRKLIAEEKLVADMMPIFSP